MRRILAAAAIAGTLGCGGTSPRFGGAGDKAVRAPEWDLVIDITPMRVGTSTLSSFEASFPGGVGDPVLSVQIYQRSDELEMIVEQRRAALAQSKENTVREAERMLAAAERAGVAHMVCHNFRRIPAVCLADQIIRDGRLGEIRHFRGAYLEDWLLDPAFPLVWRLDRRKAGSGSLGDIGSHVIDLARMLVGEIAEVSGVTETFIRTRPLAGRPERKGRVTVDDAAVSAVRFASGAIGSIEATRFAPGRKSRCAFEINGSLGSLAFDLERMNELEVYFASDPPAVRGFRTILATEPVHPHMAAWWPPGHIIGWEHTFTHMMRDLLEAVADGTVPSPSFRDGVMNQRVLDAIERSSKSRRWVRVKGVA